jgi:hypothetical protein
MNAVDNLHRQQHGKRIDEPAFQKLKKTSVSGLHILRAKNQRPAKCASLRRKTRSDFVWIRRGIRCSLSATHENYFASFGRVAEKWSANVCFGGKDRRTLFITASTSLYSIRMNVKGANPAK